MKTSELQLEDSSGGATRPDHFENSGPGSPTFPQGDEHSAFIPKRDEAVLEELAKRGFDFCFSILILIPLFPFLCLLAVLISLESQGSPLFIQERVGKNGRRFKMYKFRTMRTGGGDELHRKIAIQSIKASTVKVNLNEDQLLTGKVQNDPRITRMGKILRRYSLDELPNFFNVIIGDMSLVGPRPPIPYEVRCYEPHHLRRLSVKGGMTGIWQISGRNTLSFEQMVALDIRYTQTRSFIGDLRILFKTIPVVIRGVGY